VEENNSDKPGHGADSSRDKGLGTPGQERVTNEQKDKPDSSEKPPEEAFHRSLWGRLKALLRRIAYRLEQRKTLIEVCAIIVTTVTLIVYTIFAGGQWAAINRTNDLSASQMRLTLRPWVTVSHVQGEPTKGTWRASVVLVNTGSLPAYGVQTMAGRIEIRQRPKPFKPMTNCDVMASVMVDKPERRLSAKVANTQSPRARM
jgi:hypothetical protein